MVIDSLLDAALKWPCEELHVFGCRLFRVSCFVPRAELTASQPHRAVDLRSCNFLCPLNKLYCSGSRMPASIVFLDLSDYNNDRNVISIGLSQDSSFSAAEMWWKNEEWLNSGPSLQAASDSEEWSAVATFLLLSQLTDTIQSMYTCARSWTVVSSTWRRIPGVSHSATCCDIWHDSQADTRRAKSWSHDDNLTQVGVVHTSSSVHPVVS